MLTISHGSTTGAHRDRPTELAQRHELPGGTLALPHPSLLEAAFRDDQAAGLLPQGGHGRAAHDGGIELGAQAVHIPRL